MMRHHSPSIRVEAITHQQLLSSHLHRWVPSIVLAWLAPPKRITTRHSIQSRAYLREASAKNMFRAHNKEGSRRSSLHFTLAVPSSTFPQLRLSAIPTSTQSRREQRIWSVTKISHRSWTIPFNHSQLAKAAYWTRAERIIGSKKWINWWITSAKRWKRWRYRTYRSGKWTKRKTTCRRRLSTSRHW